MKPRNRKALILNISRASASALTALVLGPGVTLPWPGREADDDCPKGPPEKSPSEGGHGGCFICAWAEVLQRKIRMA